MGDVMRRKFSVISPLALGVLLWIPAGAAHAGTTGPAQVIAKYYANLGGSDLYQVDTNGNYVWNGTAGGDSVTSIAPGAGPGLPLVGDAGELCKVVGTQVFCDRNGDGNWDGNGGGDLAANFSPGAGVGIIFFADTTGDGVKEIVKYVNNAFQVDANQNNAWNGPAGGDEVQQVAPGAAVGVPFACDCDGDGDIELGKVVTATSEIFIDLNNNGVWDGNAGGDLATSFSSGAGPGTFVFANLTGTAADDIAKYFSNLGGSDIFQVDLNGNRVWNGTAGGDGVAQIAPGAGAGTPCAIDDDGDGTSRLCKTTAASQVFIDDNGNRTWDGNAGGDIASSFASGAGAGTFVIRDTQ
jgi:hypothetical protein